MSNERPATEIRASDAERERVAALIQHAGADGRLTIAESDERLRQVYAATYRHELTPLTVDLPTGESHRASPDEQTRGHGWRDPRNRALRIHVMIVTVLSALLVVRWVASGVPYFWPMFPMFWMWVSVAIHSYWRGESVWPFGRIRRPRRAGAGI